MTEARSLGTVAFPIGAMRPVMSGSYVPRLRATHDGAFSKAQMDADAAAARADQQIRLRCARCPGWLFEGRAGDALAVWEAHMADDHPGLKVPSRPRSREAQRAAAMVQVEKRRVA